MTRIILAVALCGSLAACSPGQMAATASSALLSPETVAKITGICRQGEPLIRLAVAMPLPASAKEVAAFVGAYCDPLLVGAVPPTTDANTPNWLQQNFGALQAAAASPPR